MGGGSGAGDGEGGGGEDREEYYDLFLFLTGWVGGWGTIYFQSTMKLTRSKSVKEKRTLLYIYRQYKTSANFQCEPLLRQQLIRLTDNTLTNDGMHGISLFIFQLLEKSACKIKFSKPFTVPDTEVEKMKLSGPERQKLERRNSRQ